MARSACSPARASTGPTATAASPRLRRGPLQAGGDRRRDRGPGRGRHQPASPPLQDALAEGRTGELTFFAFDLLHLDGYDLTEVPLLAAQAGARGAARTGRPADLAAPAQQPHPGPRPRFPGAGLAHGAGRRDLEAGGLPLPPRAHQDLAQDQVPAERRVPDRGLRRIARGRRARRAAAGRGRRRTACAMSAGSAPATRRPRPTACTPACRRCARTSRRSALPAAERRKARLGAPGPAGRGALRLAHGGPHPAPRGLQGPARRTSPLPSTSAGPPAARRSRRASAGSATRTSPRSGSPIRTG